MGIHTIMLGDNPNIPPPVEPIKLQETTKQNLLSDEDIDKLINSQLENVSKPAPTVETVTNESNNFNPPISNIEDDEPKTKKYDLNEMNINLADIRKRTLERIAELDKKQKKIADRINLIEKFISLDEKSLAIETSRQEPNLQKISAIKKSLFSQTELITETTDILLKFEAQIQGWTKTLMEIEKDKISAYQKINSLDKEQVTADGDITSILTHVNDIIRKDPSKVLQATSGTLNIDGYSGKRFEG